jgi:hypothetical protein
MSGRYLRELIGAGAVRLLLYFCHVCVYSATAETRRLFVTSSSLHRKSKTHATLKIERTFHTDCVASILLFKEAYMAAEKGSGLEITCSKHSN